MVIPQENDDYAVYTVAIQLDSSALQHAMRSKQYEDAHKIAARMMSCLHRLNVYALRMQAEEARQVQATQGQETE